MISKGRFFKSELFFNNVRDAGAQFYMTVVSIMNHRINLRSSSECWWTLN